MGRFFEFVRWFLYITTCVLIVVTVNVQLSCEDTISTNSLWQILLSGFLTALVTVLMRPLEQDNVRVGVIKIFFHYIVLCAVMIMCGCWFGWMALNPAGIVMMMISVAVVYVLVFLAGYWLDRKQADEINRKLKGKYQDQE